MRIKRVILSFGNAIPITMLGFASLNCTHRPSAPTPNENVSTPIASPARIKQSLPCAVTEADLVKTKELLASGSWVDSTADDCIAMEPSPRGVTLLMRAAFLGKLEVVNLLLDHGANVNASDSYGDTPVEYAVMGKHTEIIGTLLDQGANVNSKAEMDRTPLMTAAADGDIATINYLIDRGAHINARDAHRTTALMFAAGFKQPQAVSALLRRGANPQLKDRGGRTYVNYAKRGYPDEYLILRM